MHLLQLADELKQSNNALSAFAMRVTTIANLLKQGDVNEHQQRVFGDLLANGLNELAQQIWSSEND